MGCAILYIKSRKDCMKNLSFRFVLVLCCLASAGLCAAEGPKLRAKPLQAGRASLASGGFTLQRTFGTANFTPELAWPVDLIYDSSSEKTGAFGYAWRSPQLESSAAWDKDGVLWTAPWGERIKFHPKRQKLPKDAIRIALHEEARKGRGYFAPYSDWEADTSASRPEKSGDWTFTGRKGCKGWTFAYRDSRLSRILAPSGRSLDFAYDKAGRLLSISQDGAAFVALSHGADGLAETVSVNGVTTRLAYANGQLAVLPKTADGQIVPAVRPRLVSMRTANLDAETFSYSGNYLSATKRGGHAETFEVQGETLAERRQNILGRDACRKAAEHPFREARLQGEALGQGGGAPHLRRFLRLFLRREARRRDADGQGRSHGTLRIQREDGRLRHHGVHGQEVHHLLFHALRRGLSRQGAQGRGRQGA